MALDLCISTLIDKLLCQQGLYWGDPSKPSHAALNRCLEISGNGIPVRPVTYDECFHVA